MAFPTTKQQFADTCLRRLGHPVVQVNVTEEQIDDRIDQSLSYYWDYHFNGAEKIYIYYCPMADASWLQKEEGTRNPYYGAKMLKCGSVKEELP